ncbi:MAG: 4Fe-4S dicluster domain-containing protein [Planctomycetota bacterium]|nr:4Fe-4S dicluster domain-containing protein [Planctomycetota bacterium]
MMDMSRRVLMKLIGGGSAAAAAGLMLKKWGKLIPYVIPPEETKPGVWSVYATTCRECPAGCGMHVRHRDGRATKAEGNPDHPINHGGLCARGQSAVQGLYDPDRLRQPLARVGGRTKDFSPQSWSTALETIGQALAATHGRVAVMSDLQTSTLADVMQGFSRALGGRMILYEPFNYESLRQANKKVFLLPHVPRHDLAGCTMILSLGADFLETWIDPVRFTQEFAQMHSPGKDGPGRMVYVGPRLSMTAANADDFIQVRPGEEALIGLAMADTIVRRGWCKSQTPAPPDTFEATKVAARVGVSAERIVALAEAFAKAPGAVALGGPPAGRSAQGDATALAAALLNAVTRESARGSEYVYPHALTTTATEAQTDKFLADLTKNDVLIIHNANPVYSRPGAALAIRKAGLIVYLGTMMDETAALADWILPVDSPLEAWGDYGPYLRDDDLAKPTTTEDGRGRRPFTTDLLSLQQPTMTRLHDTRNAGDVFLALAEAAGRHVSPPDSELDSAEGGDFEAWLHRRCDSRSMGEDFFRPFKELWPELLTAGWKNTSIIELPWGWPDPDMSALMPPEVPILPPPGASQADLCIYPSVMLFDGRGANRSWLQEAPDPMASMAWGSWIDIHPRQAEALGVTDGDVIELRNDAGVTVEAPARVTMDIVNGAVALATGQGHTALGANAAGRGANAFLLVGGSQRVTIRKTGRNSPPAKAAATQDQQEREILRWTALPAATSEPAAEEHFSLPLPEGYRKGKDIYQPRPYKQHRWAMVIDLQRCTGCGACAVACYAENNVQTVGEARLRKGAEMSWLKVVPYRQAGEGGRVGFLPMMCQHCDAAPCEPVCPVYASVHSEEGLNAQVYNRCIGTRYCANNCPYKVRRFNWLNHEWARPLEMQLNPDVSVRPRGVMEKCTFCIQRIREVQWRAKREKRKVRDGEVAPACVQSCPARAFTFGDLLDEGSMVSQLTRHDARRYHVLEHLNTKPGVAYLKRIRLPEIT